MYKLLNPKETFNDREKEIIKLWKENRIFEKSLEQRDDKNSYLFYDGPPFITGVPHYGTLLPSIAKDIIPRYQTMKGKKVRRIWGWDCHGLPMESKVEAKLKLKGKKEIQEYGIDLFIQECFGFAKETSSQWQEYIDSIGRWVDFENAYKTMDRDYMESVFWAFKEIAKNGHVYEGKRTSLYSTDASSPISNFEVAMDSLYEDVTELSSMASFKLKGKERYLVAWTTTPWTLTANTALAVNPDEEYTQFKYKGKEYIVAKKRLGYSLEKAGITHDEIKVIKEFPGTELEGTEYEPLYDFFANEGNPNDFKVYLSEYVTIEDGTGVLHIAPGFGEEDFNVGKKHNLTIAMVIDDEGKMLPLIKPWEGIYLREVTPKVVEELKSRDLIFASFDFTHSLPFFRYANPLIYKTQDAWYVNVGDVKDQLIKSNEVINWVPEHIKTGRFKKGIETAPDWCISRSRFWGTPMPVWRGVDDSGKVITKIIGSLDELRQFSIDKITKITFKTSPDGSLEFSKFGSLDELLRQHYGEDIKVNIDKEKLLPIIKEYERANDAQAQAKLQSYVSGKAHYYISGKPLELHRPDIDLIQLNDPETQTVLTRIPEVFDCWMDSGSMPFAQMHYPFENKEVFENSYPADYIVEYVGQTRAWFYVLHVISNLLKDSFKELGLKNLKGNSFKNVICTGIINGNDGRKMSKSLGNYSDARETITKFSAESIRYFFMSSPLMTGGNVNVDDREFENVVKTVLNPYWNIYKYLVIYANQFNWDESKYKDSSNIMDKWIKARLQKFTNEFDEGLSSYLLPPSIKEIQTIIEEISTWFIRRSRDRFAQGSNDAISTLYYVVMTFSKTIAPLLPFTTESIYQNLKGTSDKESIHLEDYPRIKKLSASEMNLLENMDKVRALAKIGLDLRDRARMKLRQPLAQYKINVSLPKEFLKVLQEEMNVEKITYEKDFKEPELDTNITEELKLQGDYREVVRAIQDLRKKSGMKAGEQIELAWNAKGSLKNVFEKMESKIQDAVIAQSITYDNALEETLTLNEEKIGLNLKRSEL